MNIERILFPTDFSEGSASALKSAVDIVKRYNAKLYIIHVIYDATRAAESHIPHVSMDKIFKEMSDWAQEEIKKSYVEDLRGLPDVEKRILSGVPYEEIIKFAEKEKIDLIVIGTVGRSRLERFIFGSTAERVVRRAPCPVMTVRIPEHRKEHQ